MSTAVSIAFAVGLFAAITPCGLPFLLAALGLGASDEGRDPRARGARAKVGRAAATGAVAGGAFAATLLAAAAVESLGMEISDLVPALALASGLVLVGLGLRMLAGTPAKVGDARGYAPWTLLALVYGLASLPCALGLLQGLFEETAKAQGGAGVMGVALLFAAGVVTAMIAISLLAALLETGARRLGGVGRALAGGITIAGGVLAAAYWLPAVPGGVSERGGALSDPLAEASGTIGQFMAEYLLAFALVLLAAAVAALAVALRGPTTQRS